MGFEITKRKKDQRKIKDGRQDTKYMHEKAESRRRGKAFVPVVTNSIK
jgi:hypothetical protein